jgi:uncharacterized protein YndB with AHSA1/START domain
MAEVIEHEIVINAPLEVVWRTVTEPDQISRWFAKEIDVDFEPGAQGSMTFRESETPQVVNISIESVDPQHSLVYRWNYPDGTQATPANSTLVEFTLAAEGERTRLRVVETGVGDTDWTDTRKGEFTAEHTRGWVVLIDRLAELLAGERVA